MRNYTFFADTREKPLTGLFYKVRPKSAKDTAIKFKYKQLDPNSRVFDKVLGEIRADSARYAIKTNDACGFNVGGYIVTQNGLFWQITEVVTNEEEKTTKNALRWFKRVNNAEISVRMIQINDLYPIEDTYTTTCEVIISVFLNGVNALVNTVTVSSGAINSYSITDNEITVVMEKDSNAKLLVECNNGEFSTTVSILRTNTLRNKNYITLDLQR